jgi:hypothetical protein
MIADFHALALMPPEQYRPRLTEPYDPGLSGAATHCNRHRPHQSRRQRPPGIATQPVRDIAGLRSVRRKPVAYEEVLILDMPLSAAAEPVHAALAAMKHPLLSGQPATVDDQHGIRWIAGGGIGKLNPVLSTVSLTSEAYGTAIKIRGTAKEGIIQQRSAQKSVDRLMGLLTDLVDIYDIID